MIFNMNGGGTKLFAAIGVTYPAGSSCTCTNGTKTLKAKTTSGQWVFAIPESGTWTVSCTDGTDTASKTVEITSEGQSVSVELSYLLWLYKAGNEYTDVTGGWAVGSFEGKPLGSKGPDYLYATFVNNAKDNAIETAKKIDLSGCNPLAVHITENTFTDWFAFGADTTGTSVAGSSPALSAEKLFTNKATGWVYLNIASISSAYIVLRGASSGGAKIDQIYATKEVLT